MKTMTPLQVQGLLAFGLKGVHNMILEQLHQELESMENPNDLERRLYDAVVGEFVDREGGAF